MTPSVSQTLSFYNESGKQSQTIDKLGQVTSYEYDSQGQLIRTIRPDTSATSDSTITPGACQQAWTNWSRATTYVYDPLGRRTQTIFADNTTTNLTIYDDPDEVRFPWTPAEPQCHWL